MYASIRRYTGVDPRLWDRLQELRLSLETTFRQVPGFYAWYLVRTDDGLTTVTLCGDQAGADESARVTATWIQRIIPDLLTGQPTVSTGEVALQIETSPSVPG